MSKNRVLWFIVLVALYAAGAGVVAAETSPHHKTDWFAKAKYGVFVHFLNGLQNNPEHVASLGKKTSWDKCVHEFDVERFATRMEEAGAGYVIFTVMQRSRYMIAPNATYDRLTGYRPGEACSTRDLIEDLYQALNRRKIPLMLYWTGDGPCDDPQAARGLKWPGTGKVSLEFVKNWADVVREYGSAIKTKSKAGGSMVAIAGWVTTKKNSVSWPTLCVRVIPIGSLLSIPGSKIGCGLTQSTKTLPVVNKTLFLTSPFPVSSTASSGTSCLSWERTGHSRGPSRISVSSRTTFIGSRLSEGLSPSMWCFTGMEIWIDLSLKC
jgi:hypothetical protein